eukprot:2613563-Pleurochrysis_carterae.AAC.1
MAATDARAGRLTVARHACCSCDAVRGLLSWSLRCSNYSDACSLTKLLEAACRSLILNALFITKRKNDLRSDEFHLRTRVQFKQAAFS